MEKKVKRECMGSKINNPKGNGKYAAGRGQQKLGNMGAT